jgi:hypothetical protein
VSTYLSLDIDYWGNSQDDRHMFPFVQRVLALKKPTLVVRDHHHLLPHINKYTSDRLINVDYHDDIVYKPTQGERGDSRAVELEEGTWGSFVKWREGAWFQWMHPHVGDKFNDGLCDPLVYIYGPEDSGCTGWSRVTKRRGTSTIPWDDIIAVGIALSPTYWWGTGADYDLGFYQRTVHLLLGRHMDRDSLVHGSTRSTRRVLRRAA